MLKCLPMQLGIESTKKDQPAIVERPSADKNGHIGPQSWLYSLSTSLRRQTSGCGALRSVTMNFFAHGDPSILKDAAFQDNFRVFWKIFLLGILKFDTL